MPGSGAPRQTLAEGTCYAAYLSHVVCEKDDWSQLLQQHDDSADQMVSCSHGKEVVPEKVIKFCRVAWPTRCQPKRCKYGMVFSSGIELLI